MSGNVRTDLAIEVRDQLLKQTGREVDGVEVEDEKTEAALVSRVRIIDEDAGRRMGKLPGYYINVESTALRDRDKASQERLAKVFSKELLFFLKDIGPDDTVLVVGLGNWNSTPDALGPRVVHNILVTRHLWNMTPPEKRGGLRPVCGLSPGVLGLTGMETGEIVRGVVDRIQPKCVVAVDALAARSASRVCGTIQISDTGINPGSGIGNKRIGITKDTLGVPVVAVGVPTVVHAVTIVGDAMDVLGVPEDENALSDDVDAQTLRRQALKRVLDPHMGDMIVTPKEIDVLIEDVAKVLASGMNAALHPDIEWDEMYLYMQ